MEMAGKVVVVTGGAGGIGRALAVRMAQEGAKGVAVADLDAAGAERVAGEVGGLGIGADGAGDAQGARAIARGGQTHGPGDAFCAHAGGAAGAAAPPPPPA